MFSIICVYNNEDILNSFLLKSLSYQTVDYDLILIDNRFHDFNSATSALNYGSKKAKGEYLLFCHQDIKFIGKDWLEKTEKELNELKNLGSFVH